MCKSSESRKSYARKKLKFQRHSLVNFFFLTPIRVYRLQAMKQRKSNKIDFYQDELKPLPWILDETVVNLFFSSILFDNYSDMQARSVQNVDFVNFSVMLSHRPFCIIFIHALMIAFSRFATEKQVISFFSYLFKMNQFHCSNIIA